MTTKKSKKNNVLVEEFLLPTDQGAAALMMGLQKPGYIFDRMERKNEKVKVYFIKKDAAKFEEERKREEEKQEALDALALQYDTVNEIWLFWAGIVLPEMRHLQSIKMVSREHEKQTKKLRTMEQTFVKRFSAKELDEENLQNLNNAHKRIVKRNLGKNYEFSESLVKDIEKDLRQYANDKKLGIDRSIDMIIESVKKMWE